MNCLQCNRTDFISIESTISTLDHSIVNTQDFNRVINEILIIDTNQKDLIPLTNSYNRIDHQNTSNIVTVNIHSRFDH